MNTNQIGTLCVDSTDPCAKKNRSHRTHLQETARNETHDKRGWAGEAGHEAGGPAL